MNNRMTNVNLEVENAKEDDNKLSAKHLKVVVVLLNYTHMLPSYNNLNHC
jgi:hypothetical protein